VERADPWLPASRAVVGIPVEAVWVGVVRLINVRNGDCRLSSVLGNPHEERWTNCGLFVSRVLGGAQRWLLQFEHPLITKYEMGHSFSDQADIAQRRTAA
jgi:hypothetical protein